MPRRFAQVVILLTWASTFAQENIRFERISVNDGLSQADVRTIVQDKLNFLWIGTRDGLNRYDGFEFTRYTRKTGDPSSLYFNQIWDLEVDSIGNIWVASTGGISCYDYKKNSFDNFFFPEDGWEDIEVQDILVAKPYTVLLSTAKGLVTFDLKERAFKIDAEFEVLKGKQITYFNRSKTHGSWVGTESGLFIKPTSEDKWQTVLDGYFIQHIDFDSNQKVYVSTQRGLFTYDLTNQQIAQVSLPEDDPGVTEVLRMRNGDLWVAANRVVILDSNDRIKYVLRHDKFNQYSLSEDRARTFFQTKDNVVWVGTFGYGLNKLNPDIGEFYYLGEQSNLALSSNYVSSIFTHDDTTLLVGTSRGLDEINLKAKSVKHFNADKGMLQIFKIDTDRKQNIWLGTSSGFMKYEKGVLIPKEKSLRSVNDFGEWDETHLVVATRTQGIYLYNRKREVMTSFIPPSLLPEEVSCLLIEENNLWIGCKDGLKLFNRQGKLIRHFKSVRRDASSLPSAFVKALYRDTRKTLWVGTWGGGLCSLNSNDSTFTTYTTNEGLANNVVYGIVEDYSGLLWLSTNHGLSTFSRKEHSFRNFDFFDGLQSNEFNTGAYYKSVNGRVYFGGISGLNYFEPNSIIQKYPAPSVLAKSITINNSPLSIDGSDSVRNSLLIKHVKSSWQKNNLGLEFTVVDFRHAQKYAFQYSTEDTVWNDVGDRRRLEFLDLPSGHHEIKVRARKPGSIWSQDIALLKIDIVPPFWERLWFRIAVGLALCAIPICWYYFRVANLKRANEFLNKTVRERTLEIQKKNEEISAQNEEMVAQNEELRSQSDLLEEKNLLLKKSEQELVELSSYLENRVDERTKDVQLLNKELTDQNLRMEQFSFIVAHNFNGPVARLRGLLNMIPPGAVSNADLIQIVSHLNVTAKDLEEVTSDVNTVLAIKGDASEFFEVISLRDIVEMTITQLKDEIEKKSATIDLSEFQSAKMRGFKTHMQSIFFNLLQNSLKFSTPGQPCKIKVNCIADIHQIKLEFIDNGIGIDLKLAWNKIFRLYQRFTFGTSGRGFGLFLVKAQVEQMGGEISVESSVGRGAKFTIVFKST